MYEFNLLDHIPNFYTTYDLSNIWKNDSISDIPVYTPNSISIPKGISIYDTLDVFCYAIHNGDDIYLLYNVDQQGRYVFLRLYANGTSLLYKFGGRSFPQARNNPSIRQTEGNLYLSGGYLGVNSKDTLDDHWKYDFTQETWYLLKSLPSPRHSHSTLYTADRIYLFGGSVISYIDGKELLVNDLFYKDIEDEGDWTLLDNEATLPHAHGTILGEFNNYLYLLIENRIWNVSLTSDVTQASISTYDIGPFITDNVVIGGITYLMVKTDPKNPTGTIYRWNGPYTFTLIRNDAVCISPKSINTQVSLQDDRVTMDSVILGGNKPPKYSSMYNRCNTTDGFVCYIHNIFYIFDKETLNTRTITLFDEYLTREDVYLAYHQASNSIYTVCWSDDVMYVGKLDLDNDTFSRIHTSEDLITRKNISLVIVQNTLWLLGGYNNIKGYQNDQWSFSIASGSTWVKEILIEPLPSQPIRAFEWRDRLWIIPKVVDTLYRYYPSMKQWTPVYLPLEGKKSLGEINEFVPWSVIDDLLILESKGNDPILIDLESLRISRTEYSGNLWFVINRSTFVNNEGRLFVSNGTFMNTVLPDNPPYFENSAFPLSMTLALDKYGYETNNGYKSRDIEDSHPYIYRGYNFIGEYKACYADMAGVFWINNNDVRLYEFEEQVGFYTPKSDYKGNPGYNKRRIPTMEYNKRSSEPLHNALIDFTYNGSSFVVRTGCISRYRSEDGTYFNYRAPIVDGASVGYSNDGRVFIFGGRQQKEVLSMKQNGITYSSAIQLETGPQDRKSSILCQPTFLLYDLNYAEGSIEYLADIPDFYERHDYDLASDYLISRLQQGISSSDVANVRYSNSLKANYYNKAQDIIDDISVRYVTNESGTRPSPRSWAVSATHNNIFYVGGGALELEPATIEECPPLIEYHSINVNYTNPEDVDEFQNEIGAVANEKLNDFYKFDMGTMTWTQLANTPWDLLLHASTAVKPDGTEIWVVGGYKHIRLTGGISRDIYVYHIPSNTWRSFSNIPLGYIGRAKPALGWIDNDTLMIMYGSTVNQSTCSKCPCYWFNVMGDSWIIHAPSETMYKYNSDLPKTFTIMPNNQDDPWIDVLYIPVNNPPPGGHTNIVANLAFSRMMSEDWTAYEETYRHLLKHIYDRLVYFYSGYTWSDDSGETRTVFIPPFDGGNSIVQIYNAVLPVASPVATYDYYVKHVTPEHQGVLPIDAVIPLWRIECLDRDLTKDLLFEIANRGYTIEGVPYYGMNLRDLYITLDNISNSIYPTNRITSKDILLVRFSLLDGDITEIKKIVKPTSINFDITKIKDVFQHKSGDWWMVGYFKTGTKHSLRFYRFATRPDGDWDLTELPVDSPVDLEPVAIGYDLLDNVICLFDKFNVWSLNLENAIQGYSNYWRRLPPCLNYGDLFNNRMRHLKYQSYMLFLDHTGLILQFDMENLVWDKIRESHTLFSSNSYVVIDNTEIYYLGDNPGYFNVATGQGDRFIVNSDECELGIGTTIVPRTIVQRNLVIGFDINNNMLGAFIRKKGIFNKSWSLSNYFYVEKILISVDYNTLENKDYFKLYVKTDKGVSLRPLTRVDSLEPWSFDPFIRMYQNGDNISAIPDQYLMATIEDNVAEFQIIYEPPIKDFGYISRINAVLLIPKRNMMLSATDYHVSCKEVGSVGINNVNDGVRFVTATSDDPDLLVNFNDETYSEKTSSKIPPNSQLSLQLKTIHTGKIAHVMIIEDK